MRRFGKRKWIMTDGTSGSSVLSQASNAVILIDTTPQEEVQELGPNLCNLYGAKKSQVNRGTFEFEI